MSGTLNFDRLAWLDTQAQDMVDTVRAWADVNSGTMNRDGLRAMESRLEEAFAPLGDDHDWLPLPDWQWLDDTGTMRQHELGRALRVRCRPDAPRRVWLGIHYDTVYDLDHPLQRCHWIDTGRLGGPGVADAKGGLVVLLFALRAVQRALETEELGWEIYLNPDEEIGSPGSADYFKQVAGRFDFGLLFEPALPDGSMAYQRKGSGNFSIVVRGRAAHAGREHAAGRNAVVHLARLIDRIDRLNGTWGETTFNVARTIGGGPANIVPDLAVARFNVRVDSVEHQAAVEARLRQLVEEFDQVDGFTCQSWGSITSPPKIPDARVDTLRTWVERAAKQAGEPVGWAKTGGVCDGNKLFAAGLANLDTLGPRGGRIHSPEEFLDVNSLVPRAKMTAAILLAHAAGQIELSR